MFKVWCSLCFSKTVHHIAFKLGIGVNKICIYLYYLMRSHWFEFFLWNHGNYRSIYLCSQLAVKLKFLCWDYLSETIGFVPSKDGTYYGMALSVCVSVRPSVCLSVRPSVHNLHLNTISRKTLILLTSYFDMAFILLRPRKLLIWGILRKSRWPPQKF